MGRAYGKIFALTADSLYEVHSAKICRWAVFSGVIAGGIPPVQQVF
jgi:hypothetical protein